MFFFVEIIVVLSLTSILLIIFCFLAVLCDDYLVPGNFAILVKLSNSLTIFMVSRRSFSKLLK